MPRNRLRNRTPTNRRRIALLTEARELVRRSQTMGGFVGEESLTYLQHDIERAIRRLRSARVLETRREGRVREEENRDSMQGVEEENHTRENGHARGRPFVRWVDLVMEESETVPISENDLNSRIVEVMTDEETTVENHTDPSFPDMRTAVLDNARRISVIPDSDRNTQASPSVLTQLDLYLGHTSSWQSPLVAGLSAQIPGLEDVWTPIESEMENVDNTSDDPELEQREPSNEFMTSLFEILPDVTTNQPATLRREAVSTNERWSGPEHIPADVSEEDTMISAGEEDPHISSSERRERLWKQLVANAVRYASQREAYLERNYGFSNRPRETEYESDND